MQLYLDWLTADAATRARLGPTPYLAQQRLTELVSHLLSGKRRLAQVPELGDLMRMPSYLAPLIGPSLDLYQLSHFLGPVGSSTPLH